MSIARRSTKVIALVKKDPEDEVSHQASRLNFLTFRRHGAALFNGSQLAKLKKSISLILLT